MTRTIVLAVLAALAACASKGKSERREADEHGHVDDAKAGGAGAGPAGSRDLRVDHEMLRDLRITTAKAQARAAGERVSVLGELEVNQDAYAEIAPPMPARVVKVLVSPGDAVKAGQPLVELQSPELGKARAEYQAARARADLAAKALARKRELAADKLITERELREAEATATSTDAEAHVALASLTAFGSIGGGGDPSRFTLRSPIDGTVIERAVVMGQLADPSRTLLRVGDLSYLWLIAHVFERDAVRVKPGGSASVAFAALPGRTVPATIALIGREVDPSSRTIPVRLDVANADGTLRPGMSATVAMPLGDDQNDVVTVPLASVQRVGAGWAVFVPRGEQGVFEVRAIGRGRELGGEVEILSGLAAGETVVVDGAFLLKAESDKARGEVGHED
jgi:cobalt-zinc-cadmium efflux system membrane fusion protein